MVMRPADLRDKIHRSFRSLQQRNAEGKGEEHINGNRFIYCPSFLNLLISSHAENRQNRYS